MSNLKKHSVLTDEETKRIKGSVRFIFTEYYLGFVVVLFFILLFPASMSANMLWVMGLAFLTVMLFFLPYIGLMPQSGSLEPLENHELKMLKELAQAYDEIMEWVRPAAAAGLVFRVRDLKAAREVANRVEEQTFLAKEPVERQAIYAELASGTSQEDHDPGSQSD